MNWSAVDHRFMGLALQLAKKGQYTARPNPMVGCVLVSNDEVIGRGWHQKFGEAHAEVNALRDAQENFPERIKGATCYVSLEPCSHSGKTKPCVEALIKSGISKVISAMQDPNPKVSGKGHAILNEAGINTESGLLKGQAEELNKGFVSRFTNSRPWVTLKLAMSLDGRTALEDGSSQWITGTAARQDVQKLRAKQDAVITGIGTVLADNPSLNVRADDQEWFSEINNFSQPTRILLDRRADANIEQKIFADNADVWWLTEQKEFSESLSPKNIQQLKQRPLPELLEYCANKEMNNILIEAGHKIAGAFLAEKLIDEIIIYMAPILMGNRAMGLFDLNVGEMKNCYNLELKNLRQFGDDIRLIYQPK